MRNRTTYVIMENEMKSDTSDNISLANEDVNFDILKDIENQTSENIRQKRAHERITIKVHVILQPGNSSACLDFKVQGVTGDISSGGCRSMFPIPVTVGDIYRLQFDKSQLDIPLVFARCMRCKLISEDAFEAGFAFFQAIRLPEEHPVPGKSELL